MSKTLRVGTPANTEAMRTRGFWNLASQAAEKPHDTNLLGVFADHVADYDGPGETLREHVIRVGNPVRVVTGRRGAEYGHGLPSAAGVERGIPGDAWIDGQGERVHHQTTLRGETLPRRLVGVWQPAGWAGLDPEHAEYTPQQAPMATVENGPEQYELFRAVGLDHTVPLNPVLAVRYTLSLPGRKVLRLVAPVNQKHLLALARHAQEHGNHAAVQAILDARRMHRTQRHHVTKLARMRAPAGGMVGGDNTFKKGGQFLPKAFKRIRDVAAKLLKLARPLEGEPHAALTGSPVTADEVTKPFTLRHLADLEDSFKVAKDKRLSRFAKPHDPAKGLDSTFTTPVHRIAPFLDELYKNRRRYSSLKKTLSDPSLSDTVKVAHAVIHLKQEAHEFAGASKATGSDWYGPHVDALESAIHLVHGFKPGSPESSIVKHLVAATSGNTEPKDNAVLVHRMLEEGRRVNPKNPLLGVPAYNEGALRDWLAHPNHTTKDRTALMNPGRTEVDAETPPAAEHAWYLKHVLPAIRKKDKAERLPITPGYKSRPAVIVDAPGSPDDGKLAEYQHHGKPVITKEGGALYSKHRGKGRLRKVFLPIPDKAGRLQAKGWNSRGAQVEQGVERIQHLIRTMGVKDAAQWLLDDHSDAEFQSLFGFTPDRSQIGEEGPLPGSFILGAKFGPFAQNLHSNSNPERARWLTADKWWSRTWNRFLGTLTAGQPRGEHVESPRSPAERKLMAQAAATAAKEAGLKNVAELQAVLWYYEQALWRMLGARTPSSSYLDGANAILQAAGRPERMSIEKGKVKVSGAKKVKLARPDEDAGTPLWMLDLIAERLVSKGLLPTPERIVRALLAATHGAGVLQLSRPAEPLTPEHVVYVSPSTREGSTFKDASVGMYGQPMLDLRDSAMGMPTVRAVHPGIGFWRDGAEESGAVHVGDPQYLSRIGAALGKQFRQKAVLWFEENPEGTDARHVIVVPQRDPERIHADMMRHGIEYKTLVPLPDGRTRIEAVDSGDTMRPQFMGYAKEAGAQSHQIRTGKAGFLGADTREEAAKVFADAERVEQLDAEENPPPASA